MKPALMHRIKFGSLLAALLAISPALADPTAGVSNGNPSPSPIGVIGSNVAVCNPFKPASCLAPSDSVATGQVSIGATATLIAAARPGRSSVTIVNGGTTDVFIGGSGVTTTTGMLLSGTKGQLITIPTSGAVYGVVATGTESVSEMEAF